MDYLIIFIATASGLYFHWWLYVRIKRWADRDLALSMAGNDPQKRDFMLQQLARARTERIKRSELEDWLQRAATSYPD
jgi:hypothetical protein